MLRLLKSFSVAAVIVAMFGFAGVTVQPTLAASACYRLQAMTDDSGLYLYLVIGYPDFDFIEFDFNTVPGNTPVTYYVLGENDKANILETVNGIAAVIPGENLVIAYGDASATEVDSEGACTKVLGIMDGRINRRDLGAVSFVYPTKDGFDVLEFDSSTQHGNKVFSVSSTEIAAALEAARQTGQNQQIGSNSGALYGSKLYALTSGQCQLNANQVDGKLYTFIFACQ